VSPAHSPVRRFNTLPALARLALVVPVAFTVLTGCLSAAPDKTAPPVSVTVSGAPSPVSGAARTERRAAPVKVAIPSVRVTSSLMKLGLNTDGTVEVPPAEKGMSAGWYTGGAVPGEPGAAVIIGHNNTRFGKAVFHDLHKIGKGADITVTDAQGKSAHFTVTGTESVSKHSFPTQKVYGPTQDRALRLITCAGDFDAQGHPVNNLIVYATLK
jgi:sortase (surface protein transpeptidase)